MCKSTYTYFMIILVARSLHGKGKQVTSIREIELHKFLVRWKKLICFTYWFHVISFEKYHKSKIINIYIYIYIYIYVYILYMYCKCVCISNITSISIIIYIYYMYSCIIYIYIYYMAKVILYIYIYDKGNTSINFTIYWYISLVIN